MQIDRQKIINYPEDFQKEVNKQLDTKQLKQETTDGMNMTIVKTLNDTVKSCSPKSKVDKLREKTESLLKRRKNLLSQNKRNAQEYQKVNKAARKSAREDIFAL
ncbi:hypothetical protein HHI36_000438 [Cryptolaemus montrouzieri]|uniref:Uncharacterized protein n=1 Tax=Cryptolaemus montrouzieri TaxID=559131 RepID=A0ABD2P5Q7_9CUCU